jgi:hypothetical protein
MASHIGRRKFLATLGGASAAWPLTARAQQAAMPVIGYLNNGSPESDVPRLTGLRRGLNPTGYIEGDANGLLRSPPHVVGFHPAGRGRVGDLQLIP